MSRARPSSSSRGTTPRGGACRASRRCAGRASAPRPSRQSDGALPSSERSAERGGALWVCGRPPPIRAAPGAPAHKPHQAPQRLTLERALLPEKPFGALNRNPTWVFVFGEDAMTATSPRRHRRPCRVRCAECRDARRAAIDGHARSIRQCRVARRAAIDAMPRSMRRVPRASTRASTNARVRRVGQGAGRLKQ